MKIRLNKFIAESGIASRRKADELISSGKIKLNGQIITELGTQIDPEIDNVEYGDAKIQQMNKLVYYALYKPVGTISTRSDEQGRESVVDLVPNNPPVYPVGRLDADSEGLMILTNDGELTQKLSHPSFRHDKEYKVVVINQNPGKIKPKDIIENFQKGIIIDGQLMRAFEVHVNPDEHKPNLLTIKMILRTGMNRQIRKMCGKMSLEVKRLIRVRIMNLKLDALKLKPSEYKEINKNDII